MHLSEVMSISLIFKITALILVIMPQHKLYLWLKTNFTNSHKKFIHKIAHTYVPPTSSSSGLLILTILGAEYKL